MSNNKKFSSFSVLICYETNCGGETIATESLIEEFRKSGLPIYIFSRKNLERANFFHFFYWNIFSSVSSLNFLFYRVNVLYTTTHTSWLSATLFKFFFGTKIVYHFHGNRVPDFPSRKSVNFHFFTQLIKYSYVYMTQLFLFKLSDQIIVPSVLAKKKLKKQFSSSVTLNATIIPNGFNKNRLFPLKRKQINNYKSVYNIHKKKPIFLCIGRIDRVKKIDECIIDYGNLLRDSKLSNSILIIAYTSQGKDLGYFEELKKNINYLQIAKNILFLEDQEVNSLYNISDAVLFYSTYENAPLVLIEALAIRKPILVKNQEILCSLSESIGTNLDIFLLKRNRIETGYIEKLKEKMNRDDKLISKIDALSWENTAHLIMEKFQLLQAK